MEEAKKEQKTWISLGNRQFYIEDVESIYIQANHLIINFDYTDKQVVIFFGHSEKGTQNAKKVFDILGEMYNAYRIELPEDAIPDPDIFKTAYGQQISKEIQYQTKLIKEDLKKRDSRKLKKALKEIEMLKKKYEKHV